MEILDAYAGAEFAECAGRVAALYHECTALEKKITEETLDDTSRSREQSLAEFEQKEIADASLQPGEDEELEQAYRKMSNSRKIAESLAESYQLSGNDAEDGAGNSLSRALRALRSVTMYDPALEQMEEQLAEVEIFCQITIMMSPNICRIWNLMKRISQYRGSSEYHQSPQGKIRQHDRRDPAVQRGKRSLSGKTGGL